MGPERASREKKIVHGNFFDFLSQKCIHRIKFQDIKIGSLEGFEKIEFFSLFLMRKVVSEAIFPTNQLEFNFS